MTAYCVKCKTKREIKDPQPLFNAKGSPYTKGVCPVCGTAILPSAASELHAGLERPKTAVSVKPKASGAKRETKRGSTQHSLSNPPSAICYRQACDCRIPCQGADRSADSSGATIACAAHVDWAHSRICRNGTWV